MNAGRERHHLEGLYRRLKRLKSSVRIQRWELRQRRHAKGSWRRLRRVLSSARMAYAIPVEAAVALEATGAKPLEVGFELDPPLRMYWVDVDAAERIAGHRRLTVRLDARLLRAGTLALVPFEDAAVSR